MRNVTIVPPTKPSDEFSALLESLAEAAEQRALSEKDARLAEVVADDERHRTGFAFECVRLGGFVILKTTRPANKLEDAWAHWFGPRDTTDVEFGTSINLSKISRIDLVAGHRADSLGVLSYSYDTYGSDEYSTRQLGNKPFAPFDGRKITVSPNYSHISPARPHFFEAKDENDRHLNGIEYHRTEIKRQTPNYPRCSRDDAIEFRGIRSTLFVPAGLGEGVYRSILAAT